MIGVVMRSTGSFYEVLGEDEKTYTCRIRGKIRLDESKETNPVAVGDRVVFDLENDFASIKEILPRKNHILRLSVKKAAHTQVLAANIDQVLLVVTLAFPRTSLGFIDRFLVSAESFRIPQIIIFNKKDLLDNTGQETVSALMQMYESIGVTCFSLSATASDLEQVKHLLKDKTSLVAGHSGVGKSTLLNRIAPHIQQAIREVSTFSAKGKHTTTFAEMFRLDDHTFVIDTPGVKELGLVNMSPQEISDYFPEMRDLRNDCKFGSKCLHMNEPKCAVIEAVRSGQVTLSRYESYLSMIVGADNRK